MHLKVEFTKPTPKQIDFLYPESEIYVKGMSTITTLNDFGNENYTSEYMKWYLEILTSGKNDFELQKEFNDCYLRDRCIRLLVIVYLTWTNGDLNSPIDVDKVNRITSECFNEIPLEYKQIMISGTPNMNNHESAFSNLIDQAMIILGKRDDLRQISEENRTQIKEACIKRLWVN